MTSGQWSPATIVAVSLLCFSTLFTVYRTRSQRGNSSQRIPEVGEFLPLLTAWSFFAKRRDFLWENFKKTGAQIFRFRVLRHHVVAMKGLEARKMFFNEKALDLFEGVKIFSYTGPNMRDIDVAAAEQSNQFLMKQFANLVSKERLVDVLPAMLKDTDALMAQWGAEGTLDPFKELNDVVFQLIVRMGSCRELAEDRDVVSRMSVCLDNLEKNGTPIAHLLPWFPSPARRAIVRNNRALFELVKPFVEARRAATERTTDTIDLLLQAGFPLDNVVELVLGVINAGYVNTGMNVGWTAIFTGMHPEWKDKLAAEFQALLANHTENSSLPIHERLASIPLNVWEAELPVMDVVMRETLRMTMGILSLRRNLGADVSVGDKTIQTGEFLAYPMEDVHYDPEIYSDPHAFDPRRFDEGREEDKRAPLAFLAWGGGRHVCLGMRLAKLEVKLVLAMFFLTFEFQVVDAAGRVPKSLPRVDFNDLQRPRPQKGNPCYIKFKRLAKDN
ncbi:cytochrome P450 [Mycena albidolilacea]|uniref:Cytochrome P450 n=1 Tax=Mycena albidolilacea TaxID=1033008 RepID=A0AAD7EZ69_9AGAR|nr:cytochrome P450 [Mycena albidolilacea]